MSRTTDPGNTPPPTPMRRITIASCTGTTIEFYDFFIHGKAGALLPEMFQTEYHYTGTGMAYAIAGVIGSGTAPILAGRFGGEAVGWMLAAFGALSLICATFLPETRQRVMENPTANQTPSKVLAA
ncbi:hypothetical protein [Rhodococcus sp. KBW08]|uniref:hypothetical protein n=1 Tax=Rhodococcus sp. KBW08 TaxID=2144188 RepID=UPI001627FF70|nr:hypothetical protein [Rhodococcus sp. KBW08]